MATNPRLSAWWYRQRRSLRGQLILAQMAVVVVGVLTLLGALEWVLRSADLPLPSDGGALPLLPLIRQLSFRALLIAALAATLTALLTSLLLTEALLRPLRAIAHSSRRIATGHYEERVELPTSTELASVADNFNQMAATLGQIEQQRVALIGDVMHELRTPLTALGGYLEGLLDGVLPADATSFQQMDREIRRLQRLVSDLQELSRVEAGQTMLALQPLWLNELLGQVLERLAPQAQAKGLRLQLAQPLPALQVHADPDRTVQILINLVGNAIRYTPPGKAIVVRLSQQALRAEVAVIDEGIGIAAPDLPLIFERFYRADHSRDRRTGGSGIGLTIARHLAWAMGGELQAESAGPGAGSTFRLTLPLLTQSLPDP